MILVRTNKKHRRAPKRRARVMTAVTREGGRGARWPGDQARCELLYATESMRKPSCCSCCVLVVIVLLGSSSSECPPPGYLPEFATLKALRARAPRTPAGARICAVVLTRAPYEPRSRERERRSAARREEKLCSAKTKHFIYGHIEYAAVMCWQYL